MPETDVAPVGLGLTPAAPADPEPITEPVGLGLVTPAVPAGLTLAAGMLDGIAGLATVRFTGFRRTDFTGLRLADFTGLRLRDLVTFFFPRVGFRVGITAPF